MTSISTHIHRHTHIHTFQSCRYSCLLRWRSNTHSSCTVRPDTKQMLMFIKQSRPPRRSRLSCLIGEINKEYYLHAMDYHAPRSLFSLFFTPRIQEKVTGEARRPTCRVAVSQLVITQSLEKMEKRSKLNPHLV